MFALAMGMPGRRRFAAERETATSADEAAGESLRWVLIHEGRTKDFLHCKRFLFLLGSCFAAKEEAWDGSREGAKTRSPRGALHLSSTLRARLGRDWPAAEGKERTSRLRVFA
jgi:hypothetical protein